MVEKSSHRVICNRFVGIAIVGSLYKKAADTEKILEKLCFSAPFRWALSFVYGMIEVQKTKRATAQEDKKMEQKKTREEILEQYRKADAMYQAALDELQDEYYRMNEEDEEYDEICEILSDTYRLPEFEETVEFDLMDEYNRAVEKNAAQEQIDWILHKMKVELERRFDEDYTGPLYTTLLKYGKIEKRTTSKKTAK